MKKYLILPALALAACTGNGDKKTDASGQIKQDTSNTSTANLPQQNKQYCFRLTEGAKRSSYPRNSWRKSR